MIEAFTPGQVALGGAEPAPVVTLGNRVQLRLADPPEDYVTHPAGSGQFSDIAVGSLGMGIGVVDVPVPTTENTMALLARRCGPLSPSLAPPAGCGATRTVFDVLTGTPGVPTGVTVSASLQGVRAAGHGHLQDLREGFVRVLRTRPLLTVLVVWTIALGAVASTQTAQVFLAKDSFNAGDLGYGLVFGCIGLGLALGSFGAGSWVERRSVGSVYASSILVLAVGVGAAGVAPNVWVSLPCFVLAGIGNGAAVVCNSLLVQRGATDEIRGRVFTVIMSVNYAVYGLGFVVAGPLTDSVGPRWVFGGVAVVLVFTSVLAWGFARSAARAEERVAGAEAA